MEKLTSVFWSRLVNLVTIHAMMCLKPRSYFRIKETNNVKRMMESVWDGL